MLKKGKGRGRGSHAKETAPVPGIRKDISEEGHSPGITEKQTNPGTEGVRKPGDAVGTGRGHSPGIPAKQTNPGTEGVRKPGDAVGTGRGHSPGIPAKQTNPGTEGVRKPGDAVGTGRGHSPGIPAKQTNPGTEGVRKPGDAVGTGRGRGRGSRAKETAPVPEGVRRVQAAKGTTAKQTTITVQEKQPGDAVATGGGTRESLTEGTAEAEVPTKASCMKKELEKVGKEELLLTLTDLSLENKRQFSKRPNYAKIDDKEKIKLYVNYFRLTFKDIVIYHYDIDISDTTKENKIGKSLMSQGKIVKEDMKLNVKYIEHKMLHNMGIAKCREIISELFKSNVSFKRYCPVYDGQKNLFTSQPLPCKEKTTFNIDISLEGKTKNFSVTIAPVKKKDNTNIISLEPLKNVYKNSSSEIPDEVLLVYETVMSHREASFNQVHFRNSFYNLSEKNYLGYGLDIYRGYHQSVQLTKSGPVVVINLAAKAFHQAGPVIDYACEVLRTDIRNVSRLRQFEIKSLSEVLRGVQVQVTHQRQPRRYKIKGVTDQPASEIFFKSGKKEKSVVQYFLERYGKRLQYPNLPCLHMQCSNNITFIPMETCIVTDGQPKIEKLSPELTSRMIRSTAVEPKRRKESILKTAAEVNNMSEKYMNAFGLLMDVRMMQVEGRIIAAPQIAYAGNDQSRIAKPDEKGIWRIEGGKKFYKAVTIENWVLISFADKKTFNYKILDKYCNYLVNAARKCGLKLNYPQSLEIYGREISTEQALLKVKKSEAQMAIVVLNRKDKYHTYDEVKFLADFKYNLVTQCMEDNTLLRINDQISTNICLKINVKLGGINHILLKKHQVFNEPVIVLGVDVIHWMQGYGYPSIVSVVGSLDPFASRYALTCELQRNDNESKISQEIIKNMKAIGKEILNKFMEANRGREPVKIIVFRDGVSDGQFNPALEYEVSGLQNACLELFRDIKPITYLVVKKRHQTRLFPVNPDQGIGRNRNVPPGTCVDKDITHPIYWDYFICSHEGIQGTSKPIHYTILHDDNHFNSEELQQLCHFLCHTFARCTRSVSLPAPVIYADLAATRAKKYADLFVASNRASSTGSDSTQRNLPPDVEKAIRQMQSFENNMFYV